MSDEPVDRTYAGRPMRVLRAGYGRITSNAGSGAYEITELHWDGSADQDGDAPGWLEETASRDFHNRDTGAEDDVVCWWEQYRQGGAIEVCIDVASAPAMDLFKQYRVRVATTAGDGNATVDSRDWRERLAHYELICFGDWVGSDPAPEDVCHSSIDNGVDMGYHNTFWCGSNAGVCPLTGTDWWPIATPLATFWAGAELDFQVNSTTGALRWVWSGMNNAASAVTGILRVYAGAKQDTNDTNAT